MAGEKRDILDISHVSSRNGTSFRITLPKKVSNALELTPKDYLVVFYCEDGKIILDKLRDL